MVKQRSTSDSDFLLTADVRRLAQTFSSDDPSEEKLSSLREKNPLAKPQTVTQYLIPNTQLRHHSISFQLFVQGFTGYAQSSCGFTFIAADGLQGI